MRANADIHGQVLEGDVSLLSGKDVLTMARLSKGDVLVVVGGPPCQPFSKAAYWTDDGSEAAYRRARANGLLAERPTAKKVAKKDARRDLRKF